MRFLLNEDLSEDNIEDYIENSFDNIKIIIEKIFKTHNEINRIKIRKSSIFDTLEDIIHFVNNKIYSKLTGNISNDYATDLENDIIKYLRLSQKIDKVELLNKIEKLKSLHLEQIN